MPTMVFLEFKDVVPFNDHCFNVLIHGYCKARKFDKALAAMENMKKRGFNLNVISDKVSLKHSAGRKISAKGTKSLKT